jgi:hypothetical protein
LRKSFAVAVASVACSALVAAGCTSTSSGTGDKSTTPGGTSDTASPPASSSSAAPVASGNATIPVSDLGSKVAAAMKAATDFHMVGDGADDQGKPVAFDIHFATDKTAGSVTEQGQKIELINLGGSSLYFKLSGALWKQLEGAEAEAKFAGKWVKVPAKETAFKPLEQAFDRQSFVGELLPGSTADLKWSGPATVDGVAATKYVGSDGTQLFIALTGPPVILKAVDPSSVGGSITFSDYGKPYSFSEPSPGQTVDLSGLGH